MTYMSRMSHYDPRRAKRVAEARTRRANARTVNEDARIGYRKRRFSFE